MKIQDFDKQIHGAAVLAAKKTGQFELIPDMEQAGRERLVRYWHRLECADPKTVEAYAFKMAYMASLVVLSRALEFINSEVTGAVTNEDGEEATSIMDLREDGETPETILIRNELKRDLNDAMAAVARVYGQPVADALVQGLTEQNLHVETVAAAWGHTHKGAEKKLHKARKLFYDILAEKGHDVSKSSAVRLGKTGREHSQETVDEFRRLRSEGWSQRQIADKFGVGQSTIWKYTSGISKGRHNPPRRTPKGETHE